MTVTSDSESESPRLGTAAAGPIMPRPVIVDCQFKLRGGRATPLLGKTGPLPLVGGLAIGGPKPHRLIGISRKPGFPRNFGRKFTKLELASALRARGARRRRRVVGRHVASRLPVRPLLRAGHLNRFTSPSDYQMRANQAYPGAGPLQLVPACHPRPWAALEPRSKQTAPT